MEYEVDWTINLKERKMDWKLARRTENSSSTYFTEFMFRIMFADKDLFQTMLPRIAKHCTVEA